MCGGIKLRLIWQSSPLAPCRCSSAWETISSAYILLGLTSVWSQSSNPQSADYVDHTVHKRTIFRELSFGDPTDLTTVCSSSLSGQDIFQISQVRQKQSEHVEHGTCRHMNHIECTLTLVHESFRGTELSDKISLVIITGSMDCWTVMSPIDPTRGSQRSAASLSRNKSNRNRILHPPQMLV